MKTLARLAIGIVFLACAFGASQAGTVIVVDTWSYDQHSESGTHTLYLGDNSARVDFKGKESDVTVIYRLDDEKNPVMWVIDNAALEYTELDKDKVGKAYGQMQQQMEMMDTYLADKSQEERDQLKEQYRKQLRQANKLMNFEERGKKMKYEKVEGGMDVNGRTADHYKAFFNKELYEEVWVAGWETLGLDPNDMTVLNRMGEEFRGFAGDMMPIAGKTVEKGDGTIDGFPVKIVLYEDGKKYLKKEVKEIRTEDLDPGLFDLPDGVEKAGG